MKKHFLADRLTQAEIYLFNFLAGKLFMATVDDFLIEVDGKLDAVIKNQASPVTVDLSAVLSAIADLKAAIVPTPPASTTAPAPAPAPAA